MNLVIVESPAKCQKIQGFLGAGWKVTASMGHIRALEHSIDAIGIERDFEPKYEFLKEKGKAIKQLKEMASGATEIYLAADDDREGEFIALSVCILLKMNVKTAKRAVFHEITKKAVLNAIENPRTIDMNRVNAQQSRAMLDMMIGFTMSPLLWRYVAPGLSAGRCQTPALRLVVERENEIAGFKSSSSWYLALEWKTEGLKPAFKFPATLDDELEDEESAVNYMENIHNIQEGTVTSKDIRNWTEKPPLPLITSTLQQQASAIYHINPKQTMRIAQKLYEAGHITYMRTDKAVMSDEAIQEGKSWVRKTYGDEYVGTTSGSFASKAKKGKSANTTDAPAKAQEAHECIRPTHMDCTEISGEWSHQEKKLYHLIWQRAIQSVMAAAHGEYCKVCTQIDGDEDFTWSSQWKRTLFQGWKIAGKVAKIDDTDDENADDEESKWNQANKLEIGTKLSWTQMKAEPKETKAAPRYTEATLVRELEKHGIGRPSTFANLLTTIQDKGYVETKDIQARDIKIKEYTLKPHNWPAEIKELNKKVGAEKSKLVPTDLGRSVLDFMVKHFSDLFAYTFTSTMEKRLDSIAEGTEHWKDSLRDMWVSYKDRYEDLSSKQKLKGKLGGGADSTDARIKEFSNGIKAVISKKGPLLLIEGKTKEETIFLGWPTGISFQDVTEEQAQQFKDTYDANTKNAGIGEWNDKPIVKKSGKFGDYIQCGDVSVTYIKDESLADTIKRLEAKQDGVAKNSLKKFKEYEIKNGQYGPYIVKTSLKKVQFVSVPKNTNIDELTEKDVATLYKDGLEKKKTAKKFYAKGNKKTA